MGVWFLLRLKPLPKSWRWGKKSFYAIMFITLSFGILLFVYLFTRVGMPLLTFGGCVVLFVEALSSLVDFRGMYAWLYLTGAIGLITTATSYIFLVRM